MSGRGWALVTGGARRIGAALALEAARAGYDLVIHHRGGAGEAAALAKRIEDLGRDVVVRAAELTGARAPGDLIGAAPGPVTLLINNAALFENDRIDSLSRAGFDEVMASNLGAPVLLAQAFAAALPRNLDGLIVNMTDQKVWRLTPQYFSYTVSKAALWAATQILAQAFAPRIRVNAIAPGPTLGSVHQAPGEFEREAGAVPLGAGPSLDDIARALRYLIDQPSVTGQMLTVDGGQHLAWRTPDVIGD